MIGVVATIKVKPGTGADFEATAARLVEAVNANEDGCLFYQLFKSENENEYRFLEAYKDMDAVGAHRAADHFKTIGKEMGAFMAGPPDVIRMDGAG
ncbi:putative quinol monooxygenase [Minwuia sp.]|uniref:putative quinol monooxygenase n=1 Tax=Minwuia sp. TaxID=2493630 RepID=UPI003A8DAF09